MQRTVVGPCVRLCLLLAIVLRATAALGQVVINELLPDPAGSDGGHEFVELLNTGTTAVDLGGWQLQFANGAEAAAWETRWTGVPGRVLAPGARFLIVDRNWAGAAPGDAEVALALQNGPDAIRLAVEGQSRDIVGYGALTDPLLMEARPAPVTPGRSLARRPDGRDTDDNRADFAAAEPTPGAANFAARSLVPVESAVEPPSLPRAGRAVSIAVLLRNEGTESLPAARLHLACGADTVSAVLDAVTSGEERRFEWTLRPGREGRWPLRLLLPLADPVETLRVGLGEFQVGPAALVLGEILGAPRSGQGEWLELEAVGPAPVSIAGWTIRDDDGAWAHLPAAQLAAGERMLVAQDSLALGAWLAANAGGPADALGCGAPVRPLSPWPAINNAAPDGRLRADRIQLADSTGVVVDHVDLGPDGEALPADRSLERIAIVPPAGDGWAQSLAAAGGTPGCPNSVTAGDRGAVSGGGEIVAEPPVADRERGQVAIHLAFDVPEGAAGWDLSVYDLDGRQVRDLGGDGQGAGPRSVFWDLRDNRGFAAPAGGYVASLQWRGVPAAKSLRRLLVVR